jgi:hypothetical protein
MILNTLLFIGAVNTDSYHPSEVLPLLDGLGLPPVNKIIPFTTKERGTCQQTHIRKTYCNIFRLEDMHVKHVHQRFSHVTFSSKTKITTFFSKFRQQMHNTT